MKLKMCGFRRDIDIEYANICQPDYVGFIFAKSQRQVTMEQAKELIAPLDKEIQTVGVFVNASIEHILHVVEVSGIDVIQLHGDESVEFVKELKKKTTKEVWKAFRIQSKEDVKKAKQYPADKYLFDSFSKDAYGGTGKVFNTSLLEGEKIPKPFFLAGGFTTDNIKNEMKHIKPYGIDISSGIETDGYKDLNKMKDVKRVIGGHDEK